MQAPATESFQSPWPSNAQWRCWRVSPRKTPLPVARALRPAAVGGALLFDEPMPPLRAAFLALLVASIVGLKVTASP